MIEVQLSIDFHEVQGRALAGVQAVQHGLNFAYVLPRDTVR